MLIKRCMLIALLLVLVSGVVFAGCAAPTPLPAAERPRNVQLTIVGFTAGTSMQLRADLVAEALRKEYPDWSVKAIATPKAVADVLTNREKKTANFFTTLSSWKCELGSYGTVYKEQGVDYEKVYAFNPVIPMAEKYMHFWVLNKTGLTSAKDIATKKYPIKVGFSTPGAHDLLWDLTMNFYGVTRKDIEAWGGAHVAVNFGASVGPEMMRGGKIDAGWAYTGIPNAPFLAASADLDWRLLPVAEEDALRKQMEELEWFSAKIPAGTYPPVKQDIVTVAQTEWLAYIPGTLPEGVVYWVTRGLWNQREFLASGYREFAKVLEPKYIATILGITYSPHPEALRFYREQGWIK